MNDYTRKVPRAIKVLLKKAEQGDVKAQFQLAEYYNEGKFVEKDEAVAADYFAQVVEQSKTFEPKVQSIDLFGFRRFKKQKIKLHPQTTIFVGNNGSGKTTIVEGLSLSLSWLAALIKNRNSAGHYMDKYDVNNNPAISFAVVTTALSVQRSLNYPLTLARPKSGCVSKQKNELSGFRQLAEIFRHGNADVSDFGLPIVAYYSVGRAVEVTEADFYHAKKQGNKKGWHKFDAYSEQDESKNFREFLMWFIRIDNITKNDEPDKAAIIVLETEIDLRQQMRAQLDLDNDANKTLDDKLKLQIATAQAKLATLVNPVEKEDKLHLAMAEKVKEAIYAFIPSLSNIRMKHSVNGIDMLMDKDGITISALQLSQGEKSLFSLVGDIARRLVMLNPAVDKNPLHGKGIVIIDEIDLHLHPLWQQKVVGQLNQTFPNIQFILTTHSPQVLSTVKKEHIRLLSTHEGETVCMMPIGETYGSASNDLLVEVMETQARPPIESVLRIEEYMKLIDLAQHTTEKGIALRKRLDELLGKDHHELMKADRKIARKALLKS